MSVPFEWIEDLDGLVVSDRKVVIVGYPATSCPYSAKAKRLLRAEPSLLNKVAFVEVSRDRAVEFRNDYLGGYSGTFPLVFMNQDGIWMHIGGANELETYLYNQKLLKSSEDKQYY